MDRNQIVLANLRLDGLGLEVGPSYGPIAAGLPGVRCRTLDHSTQQQLIDKYVRLGIDTSRIQPVDYVWSGQRYADLVGKDRFDWIIASHVIEHVPDLVGFVEECAEVLTPGGVLSLVVPDKRGTFDFYRPPAGLGPVVDAHLQGRRMSSPGAVAEFEMFIADYAGSPAAPRLMNTVAHARAMMGKVEQGSYHDIHAWVFTPSSFRLLVEDLHALGLLTVREAAFAEGPDEFYVQLSAAGAGPGMPRAELARRAVEELGWLKPTAETLARERDAAQAELAAIKRTLSWRITAPLRALRRGLG